MAYPNSGSLFRNEKKKELNHPDHTGTVNTTCPSCGVETEWWLSAWIKEAKNSGKKFFSLAFKEREPKGNEGTAAPTNAKTGGDQDIPF